MRKNEYNRSEYDYCVYFRKTDRDIYIYLFIYVDDILIVSVDKYQIQKMKVLLNTKFDMNDLGDTKKILGMEISRDRFSGGS